MLFYLPEEQFHLPSLLIEHCDVLSLDRKVIRRNVLEYQFQPYLSKTPILFLPENSQSGSVIGYHPEIPADSD